MIDKLRELFSDWMKEKKWKKAVANTVQMCIDSVDVEDGDAE